MAARTGQGSLRCGGCGAQFTAIWDTEGCLIGLQVACCGADPCCQCREASPAGKRRRRVKAEG